MTTPSSRSAADDHEAGAGLVATTTAVCVFLTLLLLAVQVVYALYATSIVTAAAYDAARLAAGADAAADEARGVALAEAHVVTVLGEYGRRRARVEARYEGGTVAVRVRAVNPGLLPAALRRPLGLDLVDRTVRVRVERPVGEVVR